MIGLGKEINGLYLLQNGESTSTLSCLSASVSASINKTQPYIWHARLGYFFDAKLAFLNKNNVSFVNSNKTFHCDISILLRNKKGCLSIQVHISPMNVLI